MPQENDGAGARTMIELHHLNESRSRRISWLLEELELPYELIQHRRDPQTNLAPVSLEAVHPLGKAPVLRDGDLVLIESGAIIDYLIRTYGKGRFSPTPGTADHERYLELLHYGEGSAMLPLLLRLYLSQLGAAGAPLRPRVRSETVRHLGWLDGLIAGRQFFVGDRLTGADVQLSFVAQVGIQMWGRDTFPNLANFVDRIESRPAYRRAIDRAGR